MSGDASGPTVKPPVAALVSVGTLRAGGTATLVANPGGWAVVQRGNGGGVARLVRSDGAVVDLNALLAGPAAAALGVVDESAQSPWRPTVAAVASDGRDGWVVLLAGTRGRASLASLWRLAAGARVPVLLAGPDALGRASGLGGLIDLDDGTLARVGDDVVVALSGQGGPAVVRVDGWSLAAAGNGAGGGRGDARALRMTRLFATPNEDGQPIPPKPGDAWFGRPDGSLNLLRAATGQVWTVDPGGTATAWALPPGRPALGVPPLDLPVPPGAPAARLWFYPDTPTDTAAGTPADAAVRYPALVLRQENAERVFDRDALTVRPGFPTHAMRLSAWCPDPATGDVLAVDAMSGEVFRITLR